MPSRPNFGILPYDKEEDFEWFATCWRGHGDACLPADVLPPTGVVVTLDGFRMAASVYWLTNAKTVVLGPTVTDPKLDPRLQAAALTASVEAMVAAARDACPDGMLWAAAHDPAVRNLFVNRAGFRDSGVAHTAAWAPADAFSLDIVSAPGT